MKSYTEIFQTNLPDLELSDEKNDLIFYGQDSYMRLKGNARLILFPKSNEEIESIVLLANQHKIPLVPSGGRTGLSGGATAIGGEVVVSFIRLNKVIEIDEISSSIRVQGGVTIFEVQEAAKSVGLFFPINYASVESSQVGGSIATNAGGINVIRYGMTRNWVLGLRVITGNGEFLNLNKDLIKNNSGLDLRHLFIGSEGILGFIVEATLQLTKAPRNLNTYLVSYNEIETIVELLRISQKSVNLNAFEFFSDAALECAKESKKFTVSIDKANYYAIIEMEYDNELTNKYESILYSLLEYKKLNNVVIGTTKSERENIWAHREYIPRIVNQYNPIKFDISVKPSNVLSFIIEIDKLMTETSHEWKNVWFGHIGDGNIHLNLIPIGKISNESELNTVTLPKIWTV